MLGMLELLLLLLLLRLLDVLSALRGRLSKAQRHPAVEGGRLKVLVQALKLRRVRVREVRRLAVFKVRRAVWKAMVEVGRGARLVQTGPQGAVRWRKRSGRGTLNGWSRAIWVYLW